METWKMEYILQAYPNIRATDLDTINVMHDAIDWEGNDPLMFRAGWDCAVHCFSLKLQDSMNEVMT